MATASIPCGICPGEIGYGAAACPGCGRPVTQDDRAVLQVRFEGADFQAHERGGRMRRGSKWIGILALLYAASAPFIFFSGKSEADQALANLAQFADDEQMEPIHGETHTAGELRRTILWEHYGNLVAPLVVAVLMGGLWLWARRAPLPAIACALALFVVVQVVSAVVDPSSILKGLLFKIIALVALGAGLKAALGARAAMPRSQP